MKNIIAITTAAVACSLLLTACGGNGGGVSDGTTLSQADEGTWSNLDNGAGYGMQAVILSDGSYWGLHGLTQNGTFVPQDVLKGTASVSGNSASGSYTDFSSSAGAASNTYSGTVSAQNNLNLIFNGPSNTFGASVSENSFNMSYDAIYNQPASLAAIAGNYQGSTCVINTEGSSTQEIFTTQVCGVNVPPATTTGVTAPPQVPLTISGSNLTVANDWMNGTLTPHGTTVNVFDVSLTPGATADPNLLPAGRTYKGILLQTSSGNVEIIATAGNNAYFM